MAVGDAVGAPFEFLAQRNDGKPPSLSDTGKLLPGERSHNNFGLRPGQWTDDASMGLCLADSLLANRKGSTFVLDPIDLLLRFEAWWHAGYNNAFRFDNSKRRADGSVGLGGNIGASLSAFLRHGHAATRSGDNQTSGNGSIMRAAAVALAFHEDEAAAVAAARTQSYTTHQGTEAAECSALLIAAIVRAINSTEEDATARKRAVLASLATFDAQCPSVASLARSEVEESDGGSGDRDWRWARDVHVPSPIRSSTQPGYFGSYCMDALNAALHCVHATDSFAAAVAKAVNMRGDADSVAAVTGQLAGAIYGANSIPQDWVAQVEQWDGGSIATRAHCLFQNVPLAPTAAGDEAEMPPHKKQKGTEA
jgi:ADP-ribosyl-[dinitrogen reductase] hydrolase